MKKLLVILLILMLTIIPAVSAAEDSVALSEGVTTKEDTQVELTQGKVTFEDKQSDLKATAYTEIDGVRFAPANTKQIGDKLVWETGEKQYFVFDDPTVSMAYQYSGKNLKETITLKSDKVLSFPVTLGEESKLIPWDNGKWKIVSTSSDDTMRGIVIEKPFGIDALGNYIPMEYTYDGSNLNLEYNRTITSYPYKNIVTGLGTPVYSDITYPLVIDPTWTSVGGGAYSDTTTFPGWNVTMWNTTGSTTWTVPSGVTNVSWMALGGGGGGGAGTNYGGGGGGAGGVLNGTSFTVTPGTSISISVGAGGNGGVLAVTRAQLGGNSSFSSFVANGGGMGGQDPTGWYPGGTGGSGGGAAQGAAAGLGTSGQGTQGGLGIIAAPGYGSGGGGGNSSTGGAGSGLNGGNGGSGFNATTYGLSTVACGGGGAVATGGTSGIAVCGGGNAGVQSGGTSATGSNAYMDSGSGGGGAYYGSGAGANGGNGGNGVVVIKYQQSTSTPVASFTPTGTQTGAGVATVTYTDTSTGTISDYNWSYQGIVGGNNTLTVFSTAQNVTASFGVGNFSIKHGVSGVYGSNISTQIAWVNVSMYPQIVANFTANTTTPIYPPGAVAFTDLSTPAGLGDMQWLWDFGDSSTSTTQNATHVYTTSGLKTVSLTTSQISNATNTNTMTKVNYINVTYDPTYVGVDFTCVPLTGLPGLYVTCTDNSIFGNSTTTGRIYNWSFGDGNYASSSPTASHVYPYLGEYTVGLTVNNTANLSLGSGKLIKTNYIVISSNQNTQNTWWTPHTVQLTVMDVYGSRLYDVVCNATYNQSSMPTAWINEMYGIQSGPQGDMINKTLTLGGTTGGDGTLTFTMLGSLKYDIYLTAPQYGLNNYYITAFPSDSMLNVYVTTNSQQPPTQTNNTYAQIGNQTKVYFVEPNISYGSMCIDYMDSSGLTSTITETWAFVYPNQTTIQTKTFVPGTTLSTNCYTLPNIRGIQTVWNFNATRVI